MTIAHVSGDECFKWLREYGTISNLESTKFERAINLIAKLVYTRFWPAQYHNYPNVYN